MTNDWLYPLSSKTEHWFELKSERIDDTGPNNFEKMIRAGAPDDKWGIRRNFRNVSVGDRIWPYYGTGNKDLGIAGLATILEVIKQSAGNWLLHLQ
jgi:hypothetical protein